MTYGLWGITPEGRAVNLGEGVLEGEGVPSPTVTAVGFGKANPVASNDTAAGRQQNCRVELVVSGAPIGIGPTER
jgi:outer membrane protein OmpA-like peptidoglycan-associated protein